MKITQRKDEICANLDKIIIKKVQLLKFYELYCNGNYYRFIIECWSISTHISWCLVEICRLRPVNVAVAVCLAWTEYSFRLDRLGPVHVTGWLLSLNWIAYSFRLREGLHSIWFTLFQSYRSRSLYFYYSSAVTSEYLHYPADII